MISSDDYLSTQMNDYSICKIDVHAGYGNKLLLSITTFSIFSHRRPKNTKKILVQNSDKQFLIGNEPKGYRLLNTPIHIEIPMNLNFRSILVFSQPIECSNPQLPSMKCPSNEECLNCTQLCFPMDVECDGLDTCGENEVHCNSKLRSPLTSYFYNREVLSSSQLMLIGFFLLNGSFIGFFLILSLYSSGIFFQQCRIYAKNSNQSRHTFLRYLREAIPATSQKNIEEKSVVPPTVSDNTSSSDSLPMITHSSPIPRRSILNRISFQPAPALQELEPEVEDRDVPVNDSICSPPDHQPEVFLRRQSLPFGLVPNTSSSLIQPKQRFNCRAASLQH